MKVFTGVIVLSVFIGLGTCTNVTRLINDLGEIVEIDLDMIGMETKAAPDKKNLFFRLYPPFSKESFIIDYDKISEGFIPPYDPTASMVVFCHGWAADSQSPGPQTMAESITEHWNTNLLLCDYGSYSLDLFYLFNNYDSLGKLFADGILSIMRQAGTKTEDVMLIGHSMGAHIMGMAGKYMIEETGPVANIIGFDPAGVIMSQKDCSKRLCAGQAKRVYAMHTTMTAGICAKSADVDFFVNACKNKDPNGCNNDACGHVACFEYFKNILDDNHKYQGLECSSEEDARNENSNSCGPNSIAMDFQSYHPGLFSVKTY